MHQDLQDAHGWDADEAARAVELITRLSGRVDDAAAQREAEPELTESAGQAIRPTEQ